MEIIVGIGLVVIVIGCLVVAEWMGRGDIGKSLKDAHNKNMGNQHHVEAMREAERRSRNRR